MDVKEIILGSDHAGYEVKAKVLKYLSKNYNCTITDKGTYSSESVDYPDYAHKVASHVSGTQNSFGILICGTGNGVCMTANKSEGIRAGLVWNEEVAALIRQHNNANIICLPARFISYRKMIASINTFLNTEFEGGRHQRRIDKISC